MASHHQGVIARTRLLADVLAELEDAHRDFDAAIAADDADAEDRATEADQRIADLRDEFATRFMAASGGLKLGDVWNARERAVL